MMEECNEKGITAAWISASSQPLVSIGKAAAAVQEHTWCHVNCASLTVLSPEQPSSKRVQRQRIKKALGSCALCCLEDGSYYPNTCNIKKII